ncbi:unnamed protein product [Linum trigynum]|uniref:Uncharacterized protein n=1 Tax=Linum trigynum TaxID=586398 RepID=A0AAV2DWF9_9ROSI
MLLIIMKEWLAQWNQYKEKYHCHVTQPPSSCDSDQRKALRSNTNIFRCCRTRNPFRRSCEGRTASTTRRPQERQRGGCLGLASRDESVLSSVLPKAPITFDGSHHRSHDQLGGCHDD